MSDEWSIGHVLVESRRFQLNLTSSRRNHLDPNLKWLNLQVAVQHINGTHALSSICLLMKFQESNWLFLFILIETEISTSYYCLLRYLADAECYRYRELTISNMRVTHWTSGNFFNIDIVSSNNMWSDIKEPNHYATECQLPVYKFTSLFSLHQSLTKAGCQNGNFWRHRWLLRWHHRKLD